MSVRNALFVASATCVALAFASCGDNPATLPSDEVLSGDTSQDTPTEVSTDPSLEVLEDPPVDPAPEEPLSDSREDTDLYDTVPDGPEGDPGIGSCAPLAVTSGSTWIDAESTAADTAGNRLSPPCASGRSPEQVIEIDLMAAEGSSDIVVFADCALIGFDCVLYLFSGPPDACDITQADVDHPDTICVNEAGLGSSNERLEADDLAPDRYYLAVDGAQGSGGFFGLWIWIDEHDEALCRLRDPDPLTGDSEPPPRSTVTGRDDFRLYCDGDDGSPEHLYSFEAEPGSVVVEAECASFSDGYDCIVGLAVSEGGCDLTHENVDDRVFGCFNQTSGSMEGGCANVSGGSYLLLVDGKDATAGRYNLDLTFGETITDEPCSLETRVVGPCARRINPAPITGDIIIAGSTAGAHDPIILPSTDNCAGGVAGAGDVFYELEIAEATTARFELTCPGGVLPWDCAVALVEREADWDVCDLTQGAVDGAWACEDTFGGELRELTVAAGSHFVVVTSEDAGTEGDYTLDIDFAPFR